jgi:hypothetical protein
MGRRRSQREPNKVSRKWLVAFFVGMILLAFKLVSNKIMTHVNLVHHTLKFQALDISAPQFSVDRQAMIVKTKGIWNVPSSLLSHSSRTVSILHIFRGYEYSGEITYTDVLGHDRTFTLTKVGKEALLTFDRMIYRDEPNILEIESGTVFFQDGLMKRIESPQVKLTTDGKQFVGESMMIKVGIDPHELAVNFKRITFRKEEITEMNLSLNTNLLIPGIKKLALTHIEGKGMTKDAPFDFMWNETRDDDNQLKLTGYGSIPLEAFKTIISPMKQRLFQEERIKVLATQNKMKLLQFDLLKKLHLLNIEKKFVTRFIPEGYYRKDKTFFHFDIRPDAPLNSIFKPLNAATYFKLAKDEPAKSVIYLRNSCGLGFAEACYRLGTLTESTSENKAGSRPFFELGCTLKHKDSCKKLRLLTINN